MTTPSDIESGCVFVIQNGKRKNDLCNKSIFKDNYCKRHITVIEKRNTTTPKTTAKTTQKSTPITSPNYLISKVDYAPTPEVHDHTLPVDPSTDLPEDLLETTHEDIVDDLPDDLPDAVEDDLMDTTPDDIPDDLMDIIPDDLPDVTHEEAQEVLPDETYTDEFEDDDDVEFDTSQQTFTCPSNVISSDVIYTHDVLMGLTQLINPI